MNRVNPETGRNGALGHLKPRLASLFKVNATEIDLQSVDGGLTHQTCICQIAGRRYFVKIYRPVGNLSFAVGNINRLTSYMCDRGVPASRVVLNSPEIEDIVVHELIEGETASGDFSQIKAIAQLYSQVALIGTEHGKCLSKSEYLADINTYIKSLQNIEPLGFKVDTSIHTAVLELADKTLASLQAYLPDQGLFHIYMHDDFTEKNILMEGDEVKLLCDWDSYRLKLLTEHMACAACRFSTDRPLQGELRADKLSQFLQSLDSKVLSYISSLEAFARIFPLLATLKHLRTYSFRNSVVHQLRPDLKTTLLAWPLEHCLWLMANQHMVSDWVRKALAAEPVKHA